MTKLKKMLEVFQFLVRLIISLASLLKAPLMDRIQEEAKTWLNLLQCFLNSRIIAPACLSQCRVKECPIPLRIA